MSDSLTNAALSRWKELLPDDAFAEGNVGGYDLPSREGLTRKISAVLSPSTVEQVQSILRISSETGHPVYPLSTGLNIGMGSFLPVKEHCAILNLKRLNSIRELSEEGLYAVVEPGVTQAKLVDEIDARDLKLLVNVTGAARETSLIGNALERGIGYFRPRGASLAGLEVVLANGEILRSGFGGYNDAACTSVYAPGNGPDLGALFSQSNFGVVTAAGFKLMRRPESQAVLLLSTRAGVSLDVFLEQCIQLRQQQVFTNILHFANGERSRITLEPLVYDQWRAAEPNADEDELLKRVQAWLAKQPTSGWNAVCGLGGSKAQVDAAIREVKKRMSAVARIRTFTPASLQRLENLLARGQRVPELRNKLYFLRALAPLLGLAFGKPTDAPQRALDGSRGRSAQRGVLYTLPLYPAIASACIPALKRLEELSLACGFTASATLNLIDEYCMEGVISIAFDAQDEAEAQLAQQCIYKMEQQSILDGFPPYRTGIDRMALADVEDPVRRRILKGLKLLFDPEQIIAPGRYEPRDS